MIKFLLIDESSGKLYKDMYRLFDSPEKCIEEAIKLGYENFFGISNIFSKPGSMTSIQCGDVKLSMISIEVEND